MSPRTSSAAALLALAAGTAHAQPPVLVENALAACVTPQTEQRQTAQGQVLLRVTLETRQPIGHCGCPSALLAYDSHALMDEGRRSFLQSGVVNTRHAGERTLTLASDAQLAGERGIVLSLHCAAPD